MTASEQPEKGDSDRGRTLRRWIAAYAGAAYCFLLIFGALIVTLVRKTPSDLPMVPLEAGVGFVFYALAGAPLAVAATYFLRNRPNRSWLHTVVAGVATSYFAIILLMVLDAGLSRLGAGALPLLLVAPAGVAAGALFHWLWMKLNR